MACNAIICYRKFDVCYQEKPAENEAILNFSTHTKPELRDLSLVVLLRFYEASLSC